MAAWPWFSPCREWVQMTLSTEKTVVLIDDSREDRYFFERALKKLSVACNLLHFNDAAEALDFLKSERCERLDAVFVDINLPKMSGFELCARYEALFDDGTDRPRIFIVSNSINPADRQRVEDTAFLEAFIEKPITPTALKAIGMS